MKLHRLGVLSAIVILAGAAPAQWPQFGGPQRNFMVEAKGIAASWADGAPAKLWQRALGEGHSSIAAAGGRLYTMYRQGQEEAVVAIQPLTGKTIWEHRFAAPAEGLDFSQGKGPHSTPLVAGERVFAVGSRKYLVALDARTGKKLWAHDLVAEYGAPLGGRGYASSPIAHGENIILPVGGAGQSLMAFRQADGALAWRNQDFGIAPASPILINVDGQEQLVVFGGEQVAGLDPRNGALLWSHPHRTEWGLNISTPVWGEGNLLFLSSAYSTGSRVLQLARTGGKTDVKELWFSPRMRVHFTSAIRIGDTIYASSGDFGPAFLTAADIRTGRVLWQDRSFARAQLVHADGKLILLDEDGQLGIAAVSPQGLKVLARTEVLTKLAWTAPTLVDTRLYVRDRREMAAFDLGK